MHLKISNFTKDGILHVRFDVQDDTYLYRHRSYLASAKLPLHGKDREKFMCTVRDKLYIVYTSDERLWNKMMNQIEGTVERLSL